MIVERLLDNTGTSVNPSTEDGNLALIKAKTDNLDVLLSTRATEATLAAMSAKLDPTGTHANAWNNAVVAANGLSAVIDTQYVSTVTVFGNTSANVNPLRLQASQDGVNFYTVVSTAITSGNFGVTVSWGARYMRLQAGQAATLTATIAGK